MILHLGRGIINCSRFFLMLLYPCHLTCRNLHSKECCCLIDFQFDHRDLPHLGNCLFKYWKELMCSWFHFQDHIKITYTETTVVGLYFLKCWCHVPFKLIQYCCSGHDFPFFICLLLLKLNHYFLCSAEPLITLAQVLSLLINSSHAWQRIFQFVT